MFMSTVAPVGEKPQREPDLDLRRSSSPEDDVKDHNNCGFRNSGFFRAIKYPVLLMNVSGIYVPSYCVCERDLCHQTRLKTEPPDICDSDSNEAPVKSLVYLECVSGECISQKVRPEPCPNSDHPWWAMVKKIGFFLLMLCHSTNTIRYVFIIQAATKNEEALVFSLTTYFLLTSYFYLMAFNSHACYRHFTPFLSAVLKHDKKYGFKCNFKSYSRNNFILFLLVLLVQSTQSTVFVYGILTFFSGMKSQLWPVSSMTGILRYFGALLVGVGVFFAGCNQYGVNFLRATVTTTLQREFQRLGKEVSALMKNPEESLCTELSFDQMLERFRSLCDLMDKGYHVIKHTIAAAYIFGLPTMCLVLYGMIDGSIHLDQYIIMTFNVLTAFLIIIHTTWSLAQLKSMASSVCDGVYLADWNKFSPQFVQKMVLFTNMFCSKSFGMTVYGMFVVDWSTLLTVGGTLLTYSVVVIQFRVGTPAPVCHFANITA